MNEDDLQHAENVAIERGLRPKRPRGQGATMPSGARSTSTESRATHPRALGRDAKPIRDDLPPLARKRGVGEHGAVANRHGTFGYTVWLPEDGHVGMRMKLEFVPFAPPASGRLVFIQTIAERVAGQPYRRPGMQAELYVHQRCIDIGFPASGTDPILQETEQVLLDPVTGEKDRKWGRQDTQRVDLIDLPGLPTAVGSARARSGQVFETAALALDGPEKGRFFGRIEWGYDTDDAGVVRLHRPVPRDDVTTAYIDALRAFLRWANRRQSHVPPIFTLSMRGEGASSVDARKRLRAIAAWLAADPDDWVWLLASGSASGTRAARHAVARMHANTVGAALRALRVPDAQIRYAYVEPEAASSANADTVDVIFLDRGAQEAGPRPARKK